MSPVRSLDTLGRFVRLAELRRLTGPLLVDATVAARKARRLVREAEQLVCP